MSRMTSKGQVTIPKRIRDYLGLKPGSEVEFVVTNDGQIALGSREARPRPDEPSRFDRLRGTLDLGEISTDEFMRLLRGDPDDDFPKR
jgi:AbrB family looped-hinge helix DNA binding protein